MNREIIDCVQGSDEWFAARLGIVTASHFKDVLNSKTGRGTYMWDKVTEEQQGRCKVTYQSKSMENGILYEQNARTFYEDKYETAVEQVGFIRMGQIGCSPDGLVGSDGIIEIKCSEGNSHYKLIAKNKDLAENQRRMPSTHIPQVQGNLWITDRQWCDFISYEPWGLKTPFYCIRVGRDNGYIDNILKPACEKFLQELNDINERLGL